MLSSSIHPWKWKKKLKVFFYSFLLVIRLQGWFKFRNHSSKLSGEKKKREDKAKGSKGMISLTRCKWLHAPRGPKGLNNFDKKSKRFRLLLYNSRFGAAPTQFLLNRFNEGFPTSLLASTHDSNVLKPFRLFFLRLFVAADLICGLYLRVKWIVSYYTRCATTFFL